MSPARFAWWLFALICLVLVFHPIFVRDAHPQAAPLKIRCMDGLCIVPQPVLQALARDAGLAQRYAEMCDWGGK